jgi:hypothetical protein
MIAFIVATPLQLFNSLNILYNNHPGMEADFFVMGFAVNLRQYMVHFEQGEKIHAVYYIDKLCSKGKMGVIKDYLFPEKAIKEAWNGKVYSDLYTTWVGNRSSLIFTKLRRSNKKMHLHFYEEGIGIYIQDICNLWNWKLEIFYKIFGFKRDKPYVEDVLAYRPEIIYKEIEQKATPIRVIDNNDEQLVSMFNKAFAFDGKVCYTQKVLYLENCFYKDQADPRFPIFSSLDQVSMLHRLEGIIGKTNLIIRKHPITTGTLYEDNGFTIDTLSNIPWELILLNASFNDKILITIMSTAVLSPKMMFNEEPWIIVLAKAYHNEFKNKEPWANELWRPEFEALILQVKAIYSEPSKIIVPTCFKDFYLTIKSLVNND